MRIGLLIYGSLDTVSGGYLYDRQLVNYLENHGDQVEVISIPHRDYSRSLLDNLSVGLYKKLSNLPVDILLQDELNHPSLFYLNQRIKGAVNYPIISIVHHLRSSEDLPAWQKPFFRTVERTYLKSVDGFVFNSQNTCKMVENMAGPRNNRVIAHPAGDRFNPEINREMIESRANKEGPLRILFLGNVIPRKGLHILLEALGKIDENDWKLSVVGSMNFNARYGRMIKQIAKDDRLDNHIEFFGSLGEEELIRILSTSHILAVPSYLEGYGIAYLEGMGFGLPAIGTASGGASEFITHDVNGYLVPRGNVSFLAECISRLIDDRELLIAMSLRARDTYLLHPTWESSMKRIRDFLEENTDPERVR